MKALVENGKIVFRLPFFENHIAKSAGARWNASSKIWVAPLNELVASHAVNCLPPDMVSEEIHRLCKPSVLIPPLSCDPSSVLKDVRLLPRQLEGVTKAWPLPGFALFWVMGAGKTLSSIALAGLRHKYGLIQKLLVICPTSIKGVWAKEFDRYAGFPHTLHVHESGKPMPRGLKSSPFPVLVVGIEAMSVNTGPEICKEFLSGGVSMTILDESSRIKHHNAKRTENILELYRESQYRLALTGTSITQGLQDLYTQMQFVEPRAIGEISYYSFKRKYCVMGGYEGKKIIGYTKTDVLMDKVRPYCDVIRKSDMKDLPLKSYQIREVQASREQREICKSLRNHLRLVMGDKDNKMKNVLEAMLRAQQVAGGFDDEGNPLSSNPKMKELLGLLEDFDGKAVIWARFLPEIEAIREALNSEYPGSVMVMTGNTPQESRQSMVDTFQKSNILRFFVSNHTVGGAGITLTSATLAVYYSNTFNLEDRLQSEDRIHRIGQTNPCMYVDISSDLAVDKSLIESIARKSSLANFVSHSLSQGGSIDSLL